MCATYVAAVDAHEGSLAAPKPSLGWQWARTVPVVDASQGLGSNVAAALSDRRTLQIAPAILLVVALGALAFSNLGPSKDTAAVGASPSAVATPSPSSTLLVTAEPTASDAPTIAPTTAPSPVPTPAPTPTAAPTAAPKPSARATYVVQQNDTLYGIHLKFGVSVAAIMDFNGLTSTVLHAGQVLLIP